MAKTWVIENGVKYAGTEVLKTAAFWKCFGVLAGVPLAVAGVLLLVDKVQKD